MAQQTENMIWLTFFEMLYITQVKFHVTVLYDRENFLSWELVFNIGAQSSGYN